MPMTDGERDVWNEMQRDAAPDVRIMQTTRQRSRKERKCDECPNPIKVGDEYDRTFIVEDGQPATVITHPRGSMCYEANEVHDDEPPY